jgi:hypothetical protein
MQLIKVQKKNKKPPKEGVTNPKKHIAKDTIKK